MNKTSFLIIFWLALSLARQASAQHALTANGAKVTIASGSSLRVNGDTQLLGGSEFDNNGSFSTSGKLTSEQAMETVTSGTVNFNGSTAQTVDGNGVFLAKNVVINNPGGLLLNIPLKVDGNILFTTGIINTSASSPLILTGNATVADVSDHSHVNGYVQKEGIGAFSYPVGNGSKYQPISVDLDENSSGFQVKYFAGDAGLAPFATTGASDIPLENYNKQEYWDLAPVGTAAGRVTVFWDDTNNAPITASENVKIFKMAHKTASGWLNEGASTVTGTIGSGSITSETISNWSPFTLGAISEAALPVTLVDFQAHLIENQIKISWSTSQEANASYFEVQKSVDARYFSTIAKVAAKGYSKSLFRYSHIDNNLAASGGISYYRLRSVDADGSFSYSRTISVRIPVQEFATYVYPNPVPRMGFITVESNATTNQVWVYNMIGREMPASTKRLSDGKIQINTSGLAQGIYLIKVETVNKSVYHRLIVL